MMLFSFISDYPVTHNFNSLLSMLCGKKLVAYGVRGGGGGGRLRYCLLDNTTNEAWPKAAYIEIYEKIRGGFGCNVDITF